MKDPNPRKPTKYKPGSEGKIRVMRSRAVYGLPLFHSRDKIVFIPMGKRYPVVYRCSPLDVTECE